MAKVKKLIKENVELENNPLKFTEIKDSKDDFTHTVSLKKASKNKIDHNKK